ncbi:Membrane protein [Streptomyces microflavus DSM 40593]|uniref:Membrane protein n=1 Tax=Streptomyces microflavus DSM 40593 TaxID=1303692 RepID=N0D6J5_STRMI|nr:Membrane protein [Streptomyces microflavus DSM 40593]
MGVMDWEKFLALWCAVWAVLALAGYGMALAGVTRAQRTVRRTGRIEQVRMPRHGGSRTGGISVVISYRDATSDEEVTVTNDGERGEVITAAWEGREVGVSHPRGRPHAYRLANTPQEPSRGLGRPAFALFLFYCGLVALVAVGWGWPWALIGLGGPLAVFAAVHLPGTVRAKNHRIEKLAAMDTVHGRIIAVLKDVTVDQDNGTSTTITPVRTGRGVRRSELPRGHDPCRGHHRPGRGRRRRRVPHHVVRIRRGGRAPERPRHGDGRRVEGTSSYGPGFTRAARHCGPDRGRGQPARQG